MKKILPIILIVIGLLLILTPFLTEQIVKYYIKNSLTDDISADEIRANNNREVEFDPSAVKDVEIVSAVSGAMDFDRELMVGILTIPDLNVNLPILKGLTNANLIAGAATMKPDQAMGQGNYTLAGHNMKNKDLLFGRLMDIDIGATVTLSDKNMIYEYKIYDTVVVPDTATDMLLDERAKERGKPIVSLMTCYHSSKTGKRFFALGELVDKYPVDRE